MAFILYQPRKAFLKKVKETYKYKNRKKLETSLTSPMVTTKAGIATDNAWLAVLPTFSTVGM